MGPQLETATMKKNKIISGTLLKIPLEHNLGFVIAKFINLNEVHENPTYNEFIYVYNYVYGNEKIDINKIEDSDLLLGGIYVLNLYFALKENLWEKVGFLEPTPDQLVMPDLKDFGPLFTKYEKDAKSWYVVRQDNINRREQIDYVKVAHLEKLIYYSYDVVVKRLTMEVLRQSGKKVEDFYLLGTWDELAPYYNMLFTTVYTEVPIDIRGKALM
jgi:hypothetical protein